MEKIQPALRLTGLFVLLAAAMICLHSCSDDDEKPKTIPEITTAAITEFTTTTATGGGTIVSNGNATITASGLVYSSTNEMPTTADQKTTVTATSGSFTSELLNLTSGTPYYVRAYATNSVGTGYGNVVTFTTGNAAPTATNVTVTGDIEIDAVLTAAYTYNDIEGDAESGTTIQWYSATDAGGAGEAAIAGATTTTYTILATDEFRFIRVGVTPKAATGTTVGVEVKSAFTTQVPEAPETVTFTYNGETVTYGVIVSPVSGRKWLDRNLGAPNAPTSHDDYANYGDMFQWGRAADGHQLVIRDAETLTTTFVNGTTTELADTDTPNHSSFIIVATANNEGNWRTPHTNDGNGLWQAPNYPNNPCPEGWHIPTRQEWAAENFGAGEGRTLVPAAYTQLNITSGGARANSTGAISGVHIGYYWTSTPVSGVFSETVLSGTEYFGLIAVTNPQMEARRARGQSCRCIKN